MFKKKSKNNRLFLFTVAVLHLLAASSNASDPYTMGMGTARLAFGGGIDAAVLNPAFLGSELQPNHGLRIPPLNYYSSGYWSDLLSLTPYKEYFSINDDDTWQDLVTHLVNKSFRVTGKSAEKTSKIISRKIDDGTSIYSNTDISLISVKSGRIAVDIQTSVAAQIDLPAAPFLILFSDKDGLKRGSDLPLTHLGAQIRACTDISFAYGQPTDLSFITNALNDLTRNFTDFKYASWGVGLTVSLGHGYLNLKTEEGSIKVSDDGTSIKMDADLKLKTTGTGLQNDWSFSSPYENGFKLAGWGAGINTGVLLYGEHCILSASLRRLGPMVWKNVLKKDFKISTCEFDAVDVFHDDLDIFDEENGGYLPDENDSLNNSGNHVGWQPTRLNIGLGYRFSFNKTRKKSMYALSEFVNTSFELEQNLAPWPGRTFVPRIAIGAENGFLWGAFPVRTGFIFGGSEKIASTTGFSIGLPYFQFTAAYKAIGSMFWFPRRGFEVAFGLSTEWHRHRDPDKDGVSDRYDSCPYSNEDIDGFQDKDGCPDPDNDADSIPDISDSCPNNAEDIDNFKDTDGCPDYDNDQDSVADSVEMCINIAEDPDNINDTDGCPETDADADSIPDTIDNCPTEPESVNLISDKDGCPDTVKYASEQQKVSICNAISSIRFDSLGLLTDSSLFSLDSFSDLICELKLPVLLYWSDSSLTDSICNIRSGLITDSLIKRGIMPENICIADSAFQQFCTQQINNTALRFKFIETVDEYKCWFSRDK